MASADLDRIRTVKAHLLREADRYEALVASLRTKAEKYAAAEAVLLELAGDDLFGDENLVTLNETSDKDRQAIGANGNVVEIQRKPDGVPAVPNMIFEALKDAAEKGAPGLTPAGLLSFVQQKYWPNAKGPDIGSAAWRLWKKGRLTKPDPDSSLYALPAQENAD